MLLSEFDPCRDAVINSEMCIKGKIENFPEVTVSCFSHHLFEAVLSFFAPEEIGRVGGANGKAPVYAVTYKGKRIAFYESRVGEPACIGDYEDLLAMGMKTLILFGNCGVLDKTIEDCGIIIPTKALRDEGLLYDPELIYYGDCGRESGHTGAEWLFKKQVTAIFCMNDLMAGGCYDWADESGIKIPQEISVAGYDNRELSSYYKPPLSTTELPLHDIGYRAAEVMIGMVEKKSAETEEPQVYKVPCKQLIRQSIKTL